jgi:hypothetical protein
LATPTKAKWECDVGWKEVSCGGKMFMMPNNCEALHQKPLAELKSLACVSGRGKEAATAALGAHQVMNGRTAVLAIKILAGRKHQIPAHLQPVGMPIASGVQCGRSVWKGVPSAFGMPNPPTELKALCEASCVEGCERCRFTKEALAGRRGAGPCTAGGTWLHCWKHEFPTLGFIFEPPLARWASSKGMRAPAGSEESQGQNEAEASCGASSEWVSVVKEQQMQANGT